MKGAEIARPPVHRITLAQFVILVPICTLVLVLGSNVLAVSLLCGGLVAILPQAYFAAMAFRWRGASAAQSIARASYAAEVGKFMISAAGFAIVFALVRPISGSMVFVGYLLMLTVQITGSWFLLRSSR